MEIALAYALADYTIPHSDEMAHIILHKGNVVAVTFSCEDATGLVSFMNEEE